VLSVGLVFLTSQWRRRTIAHLLHQDALWRKSEGEPTTPIDLFTDPVVVDVVLKTVVSPAVGAAVTALITRIFRKEPNTAPAPADAGDPLERRASELHQEGKNLEAAGDVEAAIARYTQSLAVKENFPAAFALGHICSQRRNLDSAIAAYQQAVKIDPRSVPARSLLGLELFEKGDLDAAMTEFRQILNVDPKAADGHSLTGIVLFVQGDGDRAIARFRRALELEPEHVFAHTSLGLALAQKGELHEAIATCRQAVDLAPNASYVHLNLGLALLLNGDLDGAMMACREVEDLDPQASSLQNLLSLILLHKGDFDGAIAALQQGGLSQAIGRSRTIWHWLSRRKATSGPLSPPASKRLPLPPGSCSAISPLASCWCGKVMSMGPS
jgi:Flp pilus assembly protein TadD